MRGLVVTVAATLALPVVASAQLRPPDEQRRSDQIQLMEGVLSKAVRLGAAEVNRRMQSIDPTLTVITGQARARGFVLEGYGIFFDVEVPTMSASAAWSMMTVQRDTAVAASLESLRRALASLPEGPKLQEAQQALQTVSRQVGPIQQSRGAADVAVPAVNTVVAANTSDGPASAGDGRSGPPVHRRREERAHRRDARPQSGHGSRSGRMADGRRTPE